jgi:hypothetical protein
MIEEAEYANDIVDLKDIEVASGTKKWRIFVGGHSDLTAAQRVSLRNAAGTWASLRAAWVAIDDRAGDWLDGMDSATRERLRQAMAE